jgi:hypothetical protein
MSSSRPSIATLLALQQTWVRLVEGPPPSHDSVLCFSCTTPVCASNAFNFRSNFLRYACATRGGSEKLLSSFYQFVTDDIGVPCNPPAYYTSSSPSWKSSSAIGDQVIAVSFCFLLIPSGWDNPWFYRHQSFDLICVPFKPHCLIMYFLEISFVSAHRSYSSNIFGGCQQISMHVGSRSTQSLFNSDLHIPTP